MTAADPIFIAAPEMMVKRAFLWRISIIGGLAGILYGYDIGIIDAAMLFANDVFKISDFMQEIIVSAVLVGVMVGSLLGGMIADRIGRRATLLWGCAIFVAGSMFAQYAIGVHTLIAARFVLGLSIGFTSVTAPVFLSELSPPQSRGKIVGLYQLALTLGIALSNLVGWLLADAKDWRHMFGAGAIPAIILFALTLTLPESPRWLCARGLFGKASKILNSYTNPEGAEFLLEEIRVALRTSVKTSWSALFTPAVRPFLLIASGFLMLLAVTGINAVIYYGTQIFTFAGINEAKSAIWAQLLVTIMNVLATIVGLLLIDRIGRKPLLYVGCVGMTIALFLLAIAFHNKAIFGHALGAIAIGCLVLYITCFGFSLGVIGWVLASEVFPLPVRGRGIAAASFAYGVVNLIVSLTFISLVNAMGATATFAMYGFFCIVTLIFARCIVPETKGVELESISSRPSNGLNELTHAT
jgi:sugar porter (SP) family MFS transporter